MGHRQFKAPHKTSTLNKFFDPTRQLAQAMYNSMPWRNYTKKFLEENNECYSCGKTSAVVDHIVPWKGDMILFRKLDNHCPLCVNCHNYCTNAFDKSWHSKTINQKKVEWLSKNRLAAKDWKPKKIKVLSWWDWSKS